MDWTAFKEKRFLLASQSPRRKELLEQLGLKFSIVQKEGLDEDYSEELKSTDVAGFLAEKKAKAFEELLEENVILITADTVVVLDDKILGKPTCKEDAISMLTGLSGRDHEVITGVAVWTMNKKKSFSVSTKVYFKNLSMHEIEYYIDHYQPYDKAGSYGIQEWIGLVGIERIEGSYFNVVGLPVQKLYQELLAL